MAERARGAGLVPSCHPHLRSLAECPEQNDALPAASPIGLCADVGHLAAAGGDPIATIETYGNRLQYLHLKDYDASPDGSLPSVKGAPT